MRATQYQSHSNTLAYSRWKDTGKQKIINFYTLTYPKEKIVGFDQLGGHDNFSTAMLEWRLGISKVINYKGDLSEPPGLLGFFEKC